MNEHKYNKDSRERVFVPCEYPGCPKCAMYLKGDIYRKRFCPSHYEKIHNELVSKGVSGDELRQALLEDLV